MQKFFLNLFPLLFLVLAFPCFPAGCGDDCITSADCLDNACKYCDPGAFNTCSTCCDFSDLGASECPSPCIYDSGTGQCRNQAEVDCSGVPEVPTNGKPWLIIAFFTIGFLASGLVGMSTVRNRLKTKK